MTCASKAKSETVGESVSASKRRLVYILSPSFSGSTLMTLLLALHSRIASIGELKATAMGDVSSYQCSCAQNISDCEFWQQVGRGAEQQNMEFAIDRFGTHFDSSNRFYHRILGAQVRGPAFEVLRSTAIAMLPGLRRQFEQTVEQNRKLIELVCQYQRADIFLDGSKDPHRLLYLINAGHWDIQVIRMHRDGRAQSNSRREKPRYPVDFRGAAHEWRDTIGQMDRVCSKLPAAKIHTLRYEDLCANTACELDKVWGFLAIDKLQNNWDSVDLKASEHHILGNRMRMKSNINIRLDEKWKEKVSEQERQIFEKCAGSLNRALGYQERG